MAINIITYNNIEITPYTLSSLKELKIVRKINDHGRIKFTGIVPEEEKDRYVDMTEASTKLQVNYVNDNSETTILFRGLVTNIEIKMVRKIYYIEVEGVSHSYDMDVKLKKRSFQNKDMNYPDLIEEVISDYSGSDFIDTTTSDSKLNEFILQYNETDWQFLKRMASHFNTGLVVEVKAHTPKFWFGIPDSINEVNLDDFHYSVSKKIDKFRNSSENYNKNIEEWNFTYYKIETNNLLNIGDEVRYKNRKLYVFQATDIMENSTLKHEYILAPKNGLSQDMLSNSNAKGVSIEGQVIDVKEDMVRLHLCIDTQQNKEEAYWFPCSTLYSSEGNTGLYCMPEIGDLVKLYFPTDKEEEGIILNSIRRGSKEDLDPNVKIFRTKYGKEVVFSEEEITIIGKDKEVLIKVNEKTGIQIYSTKGVSITSAGNLSVGADKLQISASNSLDIKCKDSEIQMSGETVIKGSKVRTN